MNRLFLPFLLAFGLAVTGVHLLAEPLLLPGTTEKMSIASDGQEANDHSSKPSVSADGRYAVFYSEANNLVPDDFNGLGDAFVHDRLSGTIFRIPAWGSGTPMISADGRYIVFDSNDTTLVPDDTNGVADVFVYHIQTGEIERVSVGTGGQQANGWSDQAVISADGRYVVFVSLATNLSPVPTNGQWQFYVYDRETSLTEMVSVSTNGEAGNWVPVHQTISADGRYVVFASLASNLVPNDTNNKGDVFVRDRLNGTTERISVSATGEQGNGDSIWSSISANGRYVVFTSAANNLVPGDTNNGADAIVHDLLTGEKEIVNLTINGQQGIQGTWTGGISFDGRFVSFASIDSTLVLSDTNGVLDVFVRDRSLSVTERVSVATDGQEANNANDTSLLSLYGQYTAFLSGATNLVPTDTNGFIDVFLRDRPLTTVALNYGTGASGSYFTVSGDHFPLTNTATVALNGYGLGSVATDGTGHFTVVLSSTFASPGAYYVTVQVAPYEATVLLIINPNAPVRPLESAGPVFVIPAGVARQLRFLPVLSR